MSGVKSISRKGLDGPTRLSVISSDIDILTWIGKESNVMARTISPFKILSLNVGVSIRHNALLARID
jgi:hypothetical protein